MNVRLSAVWAAIAIAIGFIVLLGYFINLGFLPSIRLLLLQWAVYLGAAALFVGLANLFRVHWDKLFDQQAGWVYSGVTIFFFLVTLVLGFWFGPTNDWTMFLFARIQRPVEASLMALLAVTLLVAGFRLFSRKTDAFRLLFLGTAVLILLGSSPWLVDSDSPLTWFPIWVAQVPSTGGARGILLGVALGATATGLRVLLGSDRPYGS